MLLNDQDKTIVTKALSLLGDSLSAPASRQDMEYKSKTIDYLRLLIGPRECETFVVLFLDARFRLIEHVELATGTVDETHAHARPIIKQGIENCARYLILSHNHPSGDPRPSAGDRAATKHIAQAASLFDIAVLDHIIIGRAPGFPAWSINDGPLDC